MLQSCCFGFQSPPPAPPRVGEVGRKLSGDCEEAVGYFDHSRPFSPSLDSGRTASLEHTIGYFALVMLDCICTSKALVWAVSGLRWEVGVFVCSSKTCEPSFYKLVSQ